MKGELAFLLPSAELTEGPKGRAGRRAGSLASPNTTQENSDRTRPDQTRLHSRRMRRAVLCCAVLCSDD